jgi:O-antigen ligase
MASAGSRSVASGWSAPWTRATWAAAIAAIVAGLSVAALYQKGAFFPGEAWVVALGSLVLIAASLAVHVDHEEAIVTAAVAALAAWWLVTAIVHGMRGSFLPEGASMLGFLCAFLAMRNLPDPYRRSAAVGLVAIGSVSAVIGLWAVAFRSYPLAMPAQGLWRAATHLTYSNAAGAMFAICVLVAFGLSPRTRWHRIAVCVLIAALVATESRGALLATLLALPVVPVRQLGRYGWSILMGLIAGTVIVATCHGPAQQLPAFVGVVCVVLLAGALPPARRLRLNRRRVIGIALLVVAALALAGIALRNPISLRLQTGSSYDRNLEWSAAVHQWRSSPITGVGPDVLLNLHTSPPSFDRFAHNEYLQMLADAGIVGIALLGLSGLAVARATHRRDVATSCAAAALVAFALAAGLDFDWHLPALALFGGWAAGMAGPGVVRATGPPEAEAEPAPVDLQASRGPGSMSSPAPTGTD